MTIRGWSRVRVAAVVAAALVSLVATALPAITGVLAQVLGVGPGMLGVFSSADACGTGLGALAAVVIMRRVSPRATLVVGLLLVIAANVGSSLIDWGIGTIVMRAVGGTGAGLALGSCTYVFGLEQSAQNYAGYLLGTMAASAATITAIPILSRVFGWHAMFVYLAVLLIPPLMLSRYLPRDYVAGDVEPPAGHSRSRVSEWLGLGAVTVSSFALGSFFAYLGSIGAAGSLTEQTIATSLSVSGLCGFISAAIAVALGERLSAMLPISLVVGLSVFGVLAANSRVPWIYCSGISAFYGAMPLFNTAQFGLLMRYAPSKRFAVHISAATYTGYALGPAAGGLIIAQYGFSPLQWLNCLLALLSCGLLWWYRRVGRQVVIAKSAPLPHTNSGAITGPMPTAVSLPATDAGD
jgi:predicted MFS family arabinose efflux permease